MLLYRLPPYSLLLLPAPLPKVPHLTQCQPDVKKEKRVTVYGEKGPLRRDRLDERCLYAVRVMTGIQLAPRRE